MIKYMKGTVFNTRAQTIVNAVNCVGVMGAGIALEFKLRYPEMFNDYVEQCRSKRIKTGVPSLYKYSDNEFIMNFPTKGHWKYPSKIQWIDEGLKYFVNNYKRMNIKSIAFPKLGTNNGGLDWNDVKILMEKYLEPINLMVYICLDESNKAEGVEKNMIDILNSIESPECLVKEAKLPIKQVETILNNRPFERFWHISKLKGIGAKSYEKIFEYLYKKVVISRKCELDGEVKNCENMQQQISFSSLIESDN